jgi:hypothetical protein
MVAQVTVVMAIVQIILLLLWALGVNAALSARPHPERVLNGVELVA